MKSLAQYDVALFHWVFNLTTNRNCRWIKWLSKTGDGQLYLVLGLMLWWLVVGARSWQIISILRITCLHVRNSYLRIAEKRLET